MIETMESGDKYSISKMDPPRTSASLTQMSSREDQSSLHILLTKLSIPINCLDNHHIRQHYLEEYSAKYSKAKHLLSNARKKQRKIIMTYYEKKGQEDDIDELQTVKESLLEENDKIKKFKEALKDKLIIYQQRIQFLKDAEFWSALEIQQLQNNTTKSIQTCTENFPDSPITNDSLHLLYDDEQIRYLDNLLDDSCPTNTDEYYFKIKSHQDESSPTDMDRLEDTTTNVFSCLTEDHKLVATTLKHRKQSHTEFISGIDENLNTSIPTTGTKHHFQWLTNYCQFFSMLRSNGQFDGWKMISTILVITIAMFLVIFANHLLEHFLIYLTKPSVPITTISPPESMPKQLFTYWLTNVYNWTTSWLFPLFRVSESAF